MRFYLYKYTLSIKTIVYSFNSKHFAINLSSTSGSPLPTSLTPQTSLLRLAIHRWVRWLHGDTAHVLVHDHLDETSISPGLAPGVLDDPVWHVTGGVVSDSEDTMVKSSSARSSEDSGLVKLESRLVGLDSDRDWLVGNGLHQSSLVHGWNILVSRDLDLWWGDGGGIASGISSSVWVLGLGDESVLHDILEGVVHETTSASTVDLVARDKLLLGVSDLGVKLAGGNLVDTLNSSNSGEGPENKTKHNNRAILVLKS